MEETIGGALVEGAFLNVLPKDADTDFITAAKEICAGVVMNVLPRKFLRLLVLLVHGGLPKESVPFGFFFVESSCAITEQSSGAEPQQ
jgi:hypothetical protein